MQQFGGKDLKRHFTVVMGGKENGLYVSSTPSSAARKAVTKLCAANKSKKVEFQIREITQGSKKKTYGPYSGYIEKLKEPIELKGRVIKYKPVAKLSGKSGVKKGGMRGGARIYECYTKIPGTEYTFKIEKLSKRSSNNHTIPFYTEYLLTINNSNPETTVLNRDAFLSHLSFDLNNEFISYLKKESDKHKKNLSINIKETAYFTSTDGYIEKFLNKCYNLLEHKVVTIEDNADLVRFVRNDESNVISHNPTDPIKVNIVSWLSRIYQWLNTP
jgi:hypothetical protein